MVARTAGGREVAGSSPVTPTRFLWSVRVQPEARIYVVVDIETNGPVPGLYSMLSLGAVATTTDGEVSSFYQNLELLPEAEEDPNVMAWWRGQPKAWEEARRNPQPPQKVMKGFSDWVASLNAQPDFVASPIGFDYAMVSWYLRRFTGKDPFTSQSGTPRTLDLKSFIAGRYRLDLKAAAPKRMPKRLLVGAPDHTHNALDDARRLAVLLRNILNDSSDTISP